MSLLYKIFLIAIFSTFLQASGFGTILEQIKAKQEGRIVQKNSTTIVYCDAKHTEIKQKKIYNKYKQRISDIKYSCDTGYKIDEYEYFYNSKKDKHYSSYIHKQYYEDETIKEEKKYAVIKRRAHLIASKAYYNNGNLYLKYVNKGTIKREDSTITYYDEYGRVSYSEYYDKTQREIKVYKDGILVREGIYKADKTQDIPLDTVALYKDNGDIKEEKFYTDGKYISKSLCSFKTDTYLKKLEREYRIEYYDGKSYHRLDHSCKRIGKSDLYVMMIPYFDYKKDFTQVMLSIIDTKNKKIKSSFFGKNSRFNHAPKEIFLDDISFLGKIDAKVFDVVFDKETNSGDTIEYFDTYKIVSDYKLIKLKKPSFKLSDIVKRAKEGENFNSELLMAMLKEIPIDKNSVDQYEKLALYLQEHNFHSNAIVLFPEIFRVFPNRADIMLKSAKSWGIVEDEYLALEAYEIYARLMKKQNKQIPKWVRDILQKSKKNHLKILNIKHKIIKLDDTHSQAVFSFADDKTIRINFLSNIDVKERFVFKDINFDGVLELLVDVRTKKDKKEYKVFQIEYAYMWPYKFNQKDTLKRFELNRRDETLIEYRDKTIDTYCRDNFEVSYYLCKQEKR